MLTIKLNCLLIIFSIKNIKNRVFITFLKGNDNPRDKIAIKYEDNYYFDGELTDFSGWNEELIKISFNRY